MKHLAAQTILLYHHHGETPSNTNHTFIYIIIVVKHWATNHSLHHHHCDKTPGNKSRLIPSDKHGFLLHHHGETPCKKCSILAQHHITPDYKWIALFFSLFFFTALCWNKCDKWRIHHDKTPADKTATCTQIFTDRWMNPSIHPG